MYASSSEVSAECRWSIDRHVDRQSDNHSRSTYRPTYRSSVSRHIDRCSTDMSADISSDTSRSTYRLTLDRYVDRHIGRHSADMSTDTSVDCRPICRSTGAQNTHDPRNLQPWDITLIYHQILKSNIKARKYDKHCIFRDKSIQCLILPLPRLFWYVTQVVWLKLLVHKIPIKIKMPLTKGAFVWDQSE